MEKIKLIKLEPTSMNEDFLVFEAGEYNPTDLVPVCHKDEIETSLCAYQAYYIKHGVNFTEE